VTATSASNADVAVARELPLDRATILAVAREVAVLLRHSAEPDDGMLTASQVAARFNVERSWVYAHAEELGVVRLGDGPRPRLRFDAASVAQRLVATPGRIPAARPSTPLRADLPLLPIKRPRRRRRLDQE
jgi:hypothetical protein